MTIKSSIVMAALAGMAVFSSSAGAADEEWTPLFDGNSLDAWRGYQMETIPAGWTVVDGILTCSGAKESDLITKEQYEDFELVVEWKTVPKGNSGILILVDESPKQIWNHAPEIQIYDAAEGDTNYQHQAGAIYELYPAKKEAIQPPGQWNRTVVRMKDGQLTVGMNDVEVASVKVGSDDWNERVAASKFSRFEQFGKNTSGHIGLQDHGQEVMFRLVKIREL